MTARFIEVLRNTWKSACSDINQSIPAQQSNASCVQYNNRHPCLGNLYISRTSQHINN